MAAQSPVYDRLRKELIVFGVLFVVGVLLVPFGVFWTGEYVFGDYADGGLGDFLSRLAVELFAGSKTLWFLVLTPYCVWQCLRLSVWGLRRGTPPQESSSG